MDKLKAKFSQIRTRDGASGSDLDLPPPPPAQPLGPSAIPRYRRQRGVNLGSWFVLERWITPGPFAHAAAPGQSDLDIAKGSDAKRVLEAHWDSWITEDDWKWIKQRGFNSVRLPVGYFHLAGPLPDVLKGTDFEAYKETFEGAWERIEKAIQTAGRYGLGVLVDLHAAAGGQNADAHSGTSKGSPSLFSSKANLASTSLALRFLASTLSSIPHVVGLQLLNEPANNDHLQSWYESTISQCRAAAGPDLPLYVHDAWDTQWYAGWTGKREDFIVLDHHLYRCFTDGDKAQNGERHAQNLRGGFKGTFAGQRGAAKGALVVAEWSASLDDRGMGGMNDGEKDRQRRAFTRAQFDLFEECAAGWWFWTLKMSDGWNAGWSAMNASQAEILPRTLGRGFKGPPPQGAKEAAQKQAHDAHTNYWKSHGGSPDPAKFGPGFSQGWDDALLFLTAQDGPHQLGFVQQWANRRKSESEAGGEKLGKAAWEWEHGFAEGIQECEKVCLA